MEKILFYLKEIYISLTREIAASPNSRSLPLIATITGVFRRLSLFEKKRPLDKYLYLNKIYLFRAISIGIPGLTIAIFINSVPRSTDITARLSTVKTIDMINTRKIVIIVFGRIIFMI